MTRRGTNNKYQRWEVRNRSDKTSGGGESKIMISRRDKSNNRWLAQFPNTKRGIESQKEWYDRQKKREDERKGGKPQLELNQKLRFFVGERDSQILILLGSLFSILQPL